MVGETLVAALCLSGLAAGCLALLRHAPPQVRFAVAIAGLAAWLVPWGAILIALPGPAAAQGPFIEWLDAAQALAPLSFESSGMGGVLDYALAAALIIGAVLFGRDCIDVRRRLSEWRARSRSANELRSLLPRELADVAADIRIVENSAAAAASGVLKPTIWLGDRHSENHRELVLLHEAWHVRAGDPLWIALIAAVRRAYWWNPLVVHLARQAVLMLESTCDHRCAERYGKADYRSGLAALLLASPPSAPRLVAAVGAASLDIQRLRLLGERLRVRTREVVLLAVLSATSAAAAAAVVVDVRRARPDLAGLAVPETPAGTALEMLLRAANGRDSELLAELLGAYTPQELALPLPASASVRLVSVLESRPLQIEYVVEGAGAYYVGELAVASATATQLRATRLRPLP